MSKPCVLIGRGRSSGLRARRVLEQKLGRPIRDGYEACHTCDTPNCIESEHLWEGTHAENMADAARKERMKGSLGRGLRTHCKKGHKYTYFLRGRGQCQTCKNEWCRNHKQGVN